VARAKVRLRRLAADARPMRGECSTRATAAGFAADGGPSHVLLVPAGLVVAVNQTFSQIVGFVLFAVTLTMLTVTHWPLMHACPAAQGFIQTPLLQYQQASCNTWHLVFQSVQ
jgi:hypothetical protein